MFGDDAWTGYSLGREKVTFAITNLLICVLVPIWGAFDFYLEPDHAIEFGILRLIDVAITAALWAYIARSPDLRANRIAMMCSAIAVGVTIAVMLPQVDHYTLYVFGFSLVFWGCGLILLWPPGYLFAAYAVILATHVAAHLAFEANVSQREFVGSLFYLFSAGLVSATQLVVRRRLEYQAFRASATLAQRNTELATTVDILNTTQARLAASSALLADSLDAGATAQHVTATLVPSVATWSALIHAGPHGAATCAASHVIPSRGTELATLLRRDRFVSCPLSRTLEHVSDMSRDDLEHLLGTDAAGIVTARSLIVAPLIVRGECTGTLVLGRTERDYTANEVAFADEIAHRAALALDNARLFRETEDALRLREDFISIASHELRTPLSALSLIVEGMLESPEPPTRTSITKLDRVVVRLAALVAQLLDVSQLSAGRLVLETEDVDLAALVRDVADQLKEIAARAGCAIELTLPPEAHGQWDRARLEQVVSNLIGNAIKYGRGHPLDVVLEQASKRVMLSVSDHGVGIAEADRARIFEKFERAASPQQYGGFGIGLWITRMIVEGMGGTIRVDSMIDRGSTFSVRLPMS